MVEGGFRGFLREMRILTIHVRNRTRRIMFNCKTYVVESSWEQNCCKSSILRRVWRWVDGGEKVLRIDPQWDILVSMPASSHSPEVKALGEHDRICSPHALLG